MKSFLKILFILLAIFQANVSEAKVFLFSEATVLHTFNLEKSSAELTSLISENYFANTCKSESDLVAYRNWSISSKGVATKGGVNAISKIIDIGKQGKHIVGHNNYMPGKSILTENAQGLLDAFHSGNVNSSQIINAVKTRVNFGKTIGNYIKDGVSTPTTNGIIINAKNGVHIVPSAPF